MLIKNRIAALLASLLVCASAAAPYGAFADNEETDVSVSEPAEGEVVSGDYTYTVKDDGSACVTNCSAQAADLVIPDSIDGHTVTELGAKFLGASENKSCKTVTIPASVDYISSANPFKVCVELQEIKVAEGNKRYVVKDGALFTADMETLIFYPPRREGTSLTIPEGVKELSPAAIYFSQLEKIVFPDSLEKLNEFSVAANEKLTSVDLSGTSLSEIPDFCFYQCFSVSEVKLPESLRYIEGGSFFGCKSLEEIELPKLLVSIGQNAFVDVPLETVTIPSTVQEIGYCALGYFTGQDGGLYTDDSLIIIGEYGSAAETYATDSDDEYEYKNNFEFYSSAENAEIQELLSFDRQTVGDYEITVQNGEAYVLMCNSDEQTIEVPAEFNGVPATKIYTSAFSNTFATKIIVPEGYKEIKKTAFMGCEYLKEITLPQSVETVGSSAFENCSSLQYADLGGAKTVGVAVFANCELLQTVIMKNAETIGQPEDDLAASESNVFAGCSELKEITLSGNCKTIGIGDEDPFAVCSALEKFIVEGEGDGSFSSKDGVLYSKDGKALMRYPVGKKDRSFKVPDGVETICDSAFFVCENLEEIDTNEVKTIGSGAFESCKNLKKATFGKSLEEIKNHAFLDCFELKSVRCYKELKNIGDYALGFYYDDDAAAQLQSDPTANVTPEKKISGFKIYADEGTAAYDYAKKYNIEVVAGTIEIFGKNIKKSFILVTLGGLIAAIGAFISAIALKRSRKKKAGDKTSGKKKESSEKKKETGEKSGGEAEDETEEKEGSDND